MGDYNCKHIFFGCKKANKEGDILFDILEELELSITNDDTPTHRPGTNIGDLLNLAIVSRQMAPRIGQDIGSDHLPVHLTLTSPEIQKQNQKEILQYEKTDWKRLNKHIEHNLEKSKAETPLEIDRDSDVLINAINERWANIGPQPPHCLAFFCWDCWVAVDMPAWCVWIRCRPDEGYRSNAGPTL